MPIQVAKVFAPKLKSFKLGELCMNEGIIVCIWWTIIFPIQYLYEKIEKCLCCILIIL